MNGFGAELITIGEEKDVFMRLVERSLKNSLLLNQTSLYEYSETFK